jgi:hypothetical protein
MSDDDLWPKPPAGGEEPDDPADDHRAGAGTGDETQPLGNAATEGQAPPPPPRPPDSGPAAVPPPHNPYGGSGPSGAPPPQNPYGAPPPPNPYGGPSYVPPSNPYPQPGSFDQFGTPQPYAPGYQPAYAGGLPDHQSATTAMVLGIVSLVGIAVCGGITLVLSPFAWAIGGKAVREIDASGGRLGGRDRAQAGRVMGIIGTVLLVLGLALLALVFGFAVSTGSTG